MKDLFVPYIIRQGDYLTKLAHRLGFDADEVWEHPKNHDLVTRRPNREVLYPGDILFVPTSTPRGLPIRAGTTNKYVAHVPKVFVSVAFHDAHGAAVADEPYQIRGLAGGAGETKKTDAEGRVTLSVPVHVRELEVFFPRRNEVYQLGIGEMDPEAELLGVTKRLENLGYRLARPWQADEESLADDLRRFQADHGLPATGKLDDETRKALAIAHGV